MPAGIVRAPLEDVEAVRMFLEEEGIAPGAHLLDVPCGIGRRAVGLAEAGFEITAVDPNEMGIAAATERIPDAVGSRLHFATASRDSLPGLPAGARFDAILCLDHALGRASTADDLAFLRRLAAHVRPEGRLVLDLLNRDSFASRGRPFAFHTIGSLEQHEFRSFDAVTAFLAVALSIFGRKMYLRLRYLFTAQGTEPRWDHLPTRLKNFIVYGIFQRKVAREGYAGVLHSFIFWAFVILGASVVEITAQAYAPSWRVPTPTFAGFSLSGPLYLAEEVIALLAAIGVGMALYRRYVIRPKKLMHEGMRDATIVLCFILGIVVSFLLFNAANATGKPLNPMRIITNMRDTLNEQGGAIVRQAVDGLPDMFQTVHTDEGIWACTTCYACVYECPVMNEHLPKIIDMRRNLVLTQGNIPPESMDMLRNIETNYNPWGIGWDQRGRWAEGLGVRTLAETIAAKEPVDVLYWVGCAASFDDRNRKVAQAFVRVLKKAGVRFAILGAEEKCTGDPARRIGNEYLAQTMIRANVATLNG